MASCTGRLWTVNNKGSNNTREKQENMSFCRNEGFNCEQDHETSRG